MWWTWHEKLLKTKVRISKTRLLSHLRFPLNIFDVLFRNVVSSEMNPNVIFESYQYGKYSDIVHFLSESASSSCSRLYIFVFHNLHKLMPLKLFRPFYLFDLFDPFQNSKLFKIQSFFNIQSFLKFHFINILTFTPAYGLKWFKLLMTQFWISRTFSLLNWAVKSAGNSK